MILRNTPKLSCLRRLLGISQWVVVVLLGSTNTFIAERVFAADDSTSESTATAHNWTLNELIDELKRSNPQLEQARQAYVAARFQVPQVSALPAPQFSLLEQANTGGPFDFNRNSDFFAYPTFTQPFLWPGKRGLAGDIARLQAEVVGRQYDSLLIQLVAQLKLDFYQLMALKDELKFMNEDLQRLEQIKEVSKVRYANNAAAYVDFLNAQVSASSLENDRFALEKQIQQQVEQINNLLGHASQTVLEIKDAETSPQLPAMSLAELIELAQKTNPAATASDLQTQAADKSLALANRSFWPDFAISVGGYTDPSLVHPERSRMYSVGVNINLPTWGFTKERAAVSQAQAQLDEARASETASLQQLDLSVANAYHGLETSLQQTRFTRERLLPEAQMAYRLALTGYGNNGGTAFSDLLTAQSSLHGTELSLIQAENTAVQAYISLAAAIGRDPASAP
jgi:outer membrane protein TolC